MDKAFASNMEGTPVSSQNTDCYYIPPVNPSAFQSTPAETPKYTKNPRKRKATDLENYDVTCPETPPFSSTLNESLFDHFENFHLDHGESTIFEDTPTASTEDRTKCKGGSKRFCSLPNTPDKQQINVNRTATSSVLKNLVSQSPLNKEAYDILYPSIPCLEPDRRLSSTPQRAIAPSTKRCLSFQNHEYLFGSVISNTVVMEEIFKYLSNGDLYRLSQTSKSFKEAIILSKDAKTRYYNYLQIHELLKENYKITPPSSPEKDSGYEDASPGSKNHIYFREIASYLNKNQSLIKCPKCTKASVVENHIAQCQNIYTCGYIFCQKCNSFSNDPKEFKDHCNNAQLNVPKPRNLLSDLSNCTATSDYATDSSSTSVFSNSLSRYESSGCYSDVEVTPKQTVKRNLSKTLSSNEIKILAVSNVNIGKESVRSQRRTSVLPVVPLDTRKIVEFIEPSSPPKIKQYAVCSKQSKRNLKRLTR